MFGRKMAHTRAIPFPLRFKDAASAVEYASAYMICKIVPGADLPAIVVDATERFGLPVPVQIMDNGIQSAVLTVCGDRGGFLAFAQTAGPRGPALRPGDLVAWRPFRFIPEVGRRSSDRRTGWAGLIVAVLEPTLITEGWVGSATFGPDTLE